jgi:hypothetical protein
MVAIMAMVSTFMLLMVAMVPVARPVIVMPRG